MLIACHLSKIYPQSERKAWPYLVRNVQLPSKFRKKREITFNFHEPGLFHRYFSGFFYTFWEHLSKGTPLSGCFHYFNRETSQKCENSTLQNNLRGALISWRKYLFNSK